MTNGSFNAFGAAIGGVHNFGHIWVGGSMGGILTAPADPVFWMHYAEIDLTWAQWQVANPGQNPPLVGTAATMDPWSETEVDTRDSWPSGSPTPDGLTHSGDEAATDCPEREFRLENGSRRPVSGSIAARSYPKLQKSEGRTAIDFPCIKVPMQPRGAGPGDEHHSPQSAIPVRPRPQNRT